MSRQFQEVRIGSARPDRHGASHFGETAQGTILDGDEGTVHVTGKNWYGEYPIEETNIAELIAQEKMKEEIDREIAAERKKKADAKPDGEESYNYLLRKLREQGVPRQRINQSGNNRIALVRNDGTYIRLPTREEFEKDMAQLEKEGLVEK